MGWSKNGLDIARPFSICVRVIRTPPRWSASFGASLRLNEAFRMRVVAETALSRLSQPTAFGVCFQEVRIHDASPTKSLASHSVWSHC